MSTASGLEREIVCPPSAVLVPRIHESGEDAERGNAIHVFARSVIAGGHIKIALAQVIDAATRATCAGIDFAVLCGGVLKVRAEVAYRLNLDTEQVTFLGINLGRRYPARAPNEIDGTNDFEGVTITGRWCVTDMKTGFNPVTPCKQNPQMQFHAAVLMLLHDVDEVEARIAYIDVDGSIRFDTHTFTRFEIDTYLDTLRARRARIDRANAKLRAGEPLAVHAGEHCTYCPARDGCPRFTALAFAMLGDLRDAHQRWGELAEEQKAEVFAMAYEARDLADRVVESMKTLARTKPITLPGGKILRETSSGVRVVNAPPPERRRRSA